VTDVFRQGYKLRGRVIRPAGVRVGQANGPSHEPSDES
jgi:molecular chaperone GrpE (heat shock protein)